MLRIGDTLNGLYLIECKIGGGTGGIVFQAEHLRLHKKVIVKLVRDEMKDKLDTRGEADILKEIKHTYLPQVYDFVEEGEEIYTVMDFVQGENMKSLLKQHGPYSQKKVLHWAGQMCEALVHLHSQTPPIIHGDIKPENIMLTPEDNICLIDFNISLLFNSEARYPIGYSKLYAAPEFFGEAGPADSKKHKCSDRKPEKTELIAASDSNLEKTELIAGADSDLERTELLSASGEREMPNAKDENTIKNSQTLMLSRQQHTQLLAGGHGQRPTAKRGNLG